MLWQSNSIKILLLSTRKINLNIRKYKREAFHREALLFNNIFKTFNISPFASIDRFDLVYSNIKLEVYQKSQPWVRYQQWPLQKCLNSAQNPTTCHFTLWPSIKSVHKKHRDKMTPHMFANPSPPQIYNIECWSFMFIATFSSTMTS